MKSDDLVKLKSGRPKISEKKLEHYFRLYNEAYTNNKALDFSNHHCKYERSAIGLGYTHKCDKMAKLLTKEEVMLKIAPKLDLPPFSLSNNCFGWGGDSTKRRDGKSEYIGTASRWP